MQRQILYTTRTLHMCLMYAPCTTEHRGGSPASTASATFLCTLRVRVRPLHCTHCVHSTRSEAPRLRGLPGPAGACCDLLRPAAACCGLLRPAVHTAYTNHSVRVRTVYCPRCTQARQCLPRLAKLYRGLLVVHGAYIKPTIGVRVVYAPGHGVT